MSPETKSWRESFIKYCTLKLRYRRALQNGQENICDLAILLSRLEEAGEQCKSLELDMRA